VGLGVIAVKAAGDFQQGMIRLVTGAGDVTDNMKQMGSAILAVSADTGVLTGPLLTAMYNIISAGQRGAEAQNTLAVAAKGAVIEQANVVDVAKALATAMTDYGTKQYNATQYMNGFIAAVAHGRLSLEEIASALGPILPYMQEFGVRFVDAASAMATMTNAGLDASVAATSLRFMIQSLIVPTTSASKEMLKLGLDSTVLANTIKKSLPDALQLVYDAALKAGPYMSKPFDDAVSLMIGGQRSLRAFLDLTGTHMKAFRETVASVIEKMTGSKGSVLGWEVALQGLNMQAARTWAALQALGIIVGLQIIPHLSKATGGVHDAIVAFGQWVDKTQIIDRAMTALEGILGKISGFLSPLAKSFSAWATTMTTAGGAATWLKNNLQIVVPIIGTIAIALLSWLIPAMWSLAGAVIAATWPLLAIGAAIAVAWYAFMKLYTAFPQVRQGVENVRVAFMTFIAWVGANFGPIFNNIVKTVQHFASVLDANIVPALQNFAHWCQQAGQWMQQHLGPPMMQIWGFLVANFLPVWRQLVAMWKSDLQPALNTIGQELVKLAPVLKMVGGIVGVVAAIIGVVLVMAIIAVVIALAAIIKGIAGFLSGLIVIIGGIGKFVAGVVQLISGFLNLILDLFTGNFGKLGADLQTMWNGIVNIFQGAWQIIVGLFQMAWFTITGIVTGFVDGVKGVFQALSDALVGHSIIPDMINAIINFFMTLPGRVGAAIMSMVNYAIGYFNNMRARLSIEAVLIVSAIVTTLSQLIGRVGQIFNNVKTTALSILNGLVSSVATAGANIMHAFANSITAGISWVTGAFNNAVTAIRNLLPHSPAKEGPLMDLDKTGPALVNTIATGIVRSAPALNAALVSLLKPMDVMLKTPNMAFPGHQTVPTGTYNNNMQRGEQNIYLQIDGRTLAQALGGYMIDNLRLNLNLK